MLIENVKVPSQIAYEGLQNARNALEKTLANLQTAQAEVQYSYSLDYSEEALVTCAQKLVQERKLRHIFFDNSLFGEPVWDILLDLYIAKYMGIKISVSSTCIAASVPATTALRYLVMMTSKGMIIRTPDANDSRVIHMSLSQKTYQAVRFYLVRIRNECG